MVAVTTVTAVTTAVMTVEAAGTDINLVSRMGSGATAVSAGEETEADLGRVRARMLTQMKIVLGTLVAAAPETVTVEVVGTAATAAAVTTTAAADEVVALAPRAVIEMIVVRIATVIAFPVIGTLMTAVAVADVALAPRSHPKMTVTSAPFSFSRSLSVPRHATCSSSLRLLAPLSRLKS